MNHRITTHHFQSAAFVARLENRARRLFTTRRMKCAEAVLVTLNCGLDGGLSEAQAISLAAPFSNAMGQSGCLCGALSGGVMACGLLLNNGRFLQGRQELRDSGRILHDRFKARYSSTCCRILTRDIRDNPRAHFRHCTQLTGTVTALATELILKARPDLLERITDCRGDVQPAGIKGLLKRIGHCVLGMP